MHKIKHKFLSWQVAMAGVVHWSGIDQLNVFIRTKAPPLALRSHLCIYKCTSEFCNRNTAKRVAKVRALGFELVLPDLRGCKCRLDVVQRN